MTTSRLFSGVSQISKINCHMLDIATCGHLSHLSTNGKMCAEIVFTGEATGRSYVDCVNKSSKKYKTL